MAHSRPAAIEESLPFLQQGGGAAAENDKHDKFDKTV
jgi:hypothetical protein